jgi:hypothetical protein
LSVDPLLDSRYSSIAASLAGTRAPASGCKCRSADCERQLPTGCAQC